MKKKIIENNYEKILLSNKTDIITFSISKLHNTYIVKKNKKKNKNFIQKLNFFFRYFFYLNDNENLLFPKKKNHLLILSNLISSNFNKDYYFGNLDKLLKKRKINSVKIFRNLSNKKTKFYFQLKKKINVLSKRNGVINECKYIFLSIREFFIYKLSKKYSFINKKLYLEDFFSIIGNLRILDQIIYCIKFYKPKNIIFTFEGHAWERNLIQYCKSKNIQTIAYQFSTISQNQYGILRKLNKIHNPDIIATSGDVTKKIFNKKIKFSKIIKLGSAKNMKAFNNKDKKKFILVAIDYEYEMTNEMLNFIITYANINKNINFLLRLHPMRSDDKVYKNMIEQKIALLNNIKISSNSLHKDFKVSKFLLYRESSICIAALRYNIVPIFFGNDTLPNSFDDKFPTKLIINSHSKLTSIIKEKQFKKKYFQNYNKNYFTKLDVKSLAKVLNK